MGHWLKNMVHRDTYNWDKFLGSKDALKFACRDLESVDTVLKLVPGREVCVQAGGSLGVFPKYLSRWFKFTYSFEPALDLFPMMTHNAPEPNIIRIQAALGESPAFIGMSRERRDGKPTNHEGITHVSGPGPIPTLRLDDFKFPVVDLLYLDLEGWEFYALKGAVETLARCRPVLSVEINKNAAYVGLSEHEIRNFVKAQGYAYVQRLHSDDVFVPVEWVA